MCLERDAPGRLAAAHSHVVLKMHIICNLLAGFCCTRSRQSQLGGTGRSSPAASPCQPSKRRAVAAAPPNFAARSVGSSLQACHDRCQVQLNWGWSGGVRANGLATLEDSSNNMGMVWLRGRVQRTGIRRFVHSEQATPRGGNEAGKAAGRASRATTVVKANNSKGSNSWRRPPPHRNVQPAGALEGGRAGGLSLVSDAHQSRLQQLNALHDLRVRRLQRQHVLSSMPSSSWQEHRSRARRSTAGRQHR